jgi:hypothetical protein
MSALQCSVCKRPAVWSILGDLFCEVDKEEIVHRHGVDRFPIERISDVEKYFIVRGRHTRSSPSTSSSSRRKSRKTRTK